MLARLSASELVEWAAYFNLEDEQPVRKPAKVVLVEERR